MLPKKLKVLIAPIQEKLLKRGFCVACMMPLKKSENRVDRGDGTEKVTCKCKRVFICDKTTNSYRRAGFDEV